jgi:hypothetical protein
MKTFAMQLTFYFVAAFLGLVSPASSGQFAPYDHWVHDGKSAILRKHPEFAPEQLVVANISYGYSVSHPTTSTSVTKNLTFRIADESPQGKVDSNGRMTWDTIRVTFNEDDSVKKIFEPKKKISIITESGRRNRTVSPGKRHYYPKSLPQDMAVSDMIPRRCSTKNLFQLFADFTGEELLLDEDVSPNRRLDVEYDYISGIDDAINVIRAALGSHGYILEPLDSNKIRAKRKGRNG